MAIKEMNALIQVKDKNGDINIIYPVTRSENIEGGDAIPEGVVSYTGQVDSDSYPNEYEGQLHTNDAIIHPMTKAACVFDSDGNSLEDIMGQNPVQVETTIFADSWVGTEMPYTNTISVEGVTETNVIDLIPPAILTEEQIDAYQSSPILNATQAMGEITLYCWGEPPKIDLPVVVSIRGNSIKALVMDEEIIEDSRNPVMNRVIAEALKGKADKKISFIETLQLGNTEVTITDDRITEEGMFSIYTNKYGANPNSVEVVGNTMTLIFPEQETEIQVKVVME